MSKHHLFIVFLLALLGAPFAFAADAPEQLIIQSSAPPQSGLSLQQAIQMALTRSPRIQAADAAVKAAAGDYTQASALPNPTLSAEMENIGGDGPYSGFDSAENTFGVSQLIEIGGKRSARTAMAEHGKKQSQHDQSIASLDLIRDVKVAYMNAVAAQEETRLTEEQTNLAREIAGNVNKRVDAAAEPIIQRNKSNVILATAEVALEKAKRSETIAMKNLSLLWGDETLPGALSATDFYEVSTPPTFDNAETALRNTPDFQRDSAALERAESAFDLEQANAVPDPTITAGVRNFQETDNQAFMVSLSIPLPVFNLNSGNIEKARQEAVQANANRSRTLLERKSRLAEHSEQMQATYVQIIRMKETILPQSEEAFKQSQHGYGLGRFPYLEVLDAQRTLADSKLTYVSALRDYHTRKAEIERIMAQTEMKMETSDEK